MTSEQVTAEQALKRAEAAEERWNALEAILKLRGDEVYLRLHEAEARLKAVQELPEKWQEEQAEYPSSPEGLHAAAAVRLCARELTAALSAEVKP